MEEIICYRCGLCGEIYENSGECKSCEEYHADYKNLKVTDALYKNQPETGKFPITIIMEIEGWSGVLAKYECVQEGSMEEFSPLTQTIDEIPYTP